MVINGKTYGDVFGMRVHNKLMQISDVKNKALSALLKSSALGQEHEYEMSQSDMINLSLLLEGGVGGYFSCSLNGERDRRLHTHGQLMQVRTDGETAMQNLMSWYYTTKEAIMACETIEELELIEV